MISLESLYKSPNALAKFYSAFKVSERLLLTGHSHQAWPDCSFEGQKQAWLDAAEFVDDKWKRAFIKADEIKNGYKMLLDDDNGHIALASSTHDLLIRFVSALPLKKDINIVTTDGEFHTIRRQMDRLAEEGIKIIKVPADQSELVVEKLISAINDKTAAVLVSKVFYNTGEIVEDLSPLAGKCEKHGAKLLIDVYHALNVVPFSVKKENLEKAFIIGGGYKYCQLGEGNCFLRFPEETDLRPVITGWYSEFGTLSGAKKEKEVLYGSGDALFAGATYDPSSHYRGAEVFLFFKKMGLTPDFLRKVSQHQVGLLAGKFDDADLDPGLITRNNKISFNRIGGFLVLYSPIADVISMRLREKGVFTDYRGSRLRLGPAPYLSDDQLIKSMEHLISVVKSVSK
jgi:kynureninase